MEKNTFTEGSVFKSLIGFALPVLGALVLQAGYGAADLLVIGRFGDATGISAVGTGSSFMQMITFVLTSLAMGSTVIIGRHIGEKRPKAAGNTVGTTIVLFAVISVILTVVLEIFAPSCAKILQVPAEAFDKTVLYIRICSGGMIFIVAYNVISCVLRGIGDARLPLVFVAIACGVNVVGDLLLMGVFRMDVAGAAFATVGAQAVSVVVSAFVIRKKPLPVEFSLNQIRVDVHELHLILKIGIPIALQEALVEISFLVINAIINKMGLVQSAGYGIAQKIISFIMLVPSSIMQSVSAFVAQNIGAEKPERAKKAFFTAIAAGCLLGIFIFTGGFFGGEAMSSIFNKNPEIIRQSAQYLKGFAPDCVLTCLLFSSIGYLNGCGKSIPVMLQGIISAFAIRVPVSIIMSRLENTNLTLVGLSTPITTVFGIIFFAVCFAVLGKKNKDWSPLKK